jgi:hypothetical protein
MKSAIRIGASWLALSSLALVAVPARAQDSNYWSSAYGTRSTLLGGVVVGSPGDISSVYYNPGALALAPNTEFLLSGNAFQFVRVAVTNGNGPRRDLVSSTIGTVPSLLAGEIPILKRDRLAYSYLTRQQVDLDMEKALTAGAESSSPLPNATFAAFELRYHQNVSEGWYGATWSHALTRTLGFGITPDLAVRSQRTTASLFAMGANAAGQQAVLRSNRDFDYMHYRLLARLGLSGVRDSLTYGITLTTPGLGVTGGGASRQSVNLTDQTGAVGNVIGASYQEGLKAEYHSPAGAAVGASYAFGGTRLHATAEWWAAVDRYTVMEGAPFTIRTPSGDSTVTAKVTDELKSVFNVGVGLEHHFTSDFSGYASYHTDRTGHPSDNPPNASVTSWDLNHVTAGVSFNAWRSNFALGLSTGFGSQPIKSFALRPDQVPPPELQTHALMVTGTLGWKISF